DLLIAIQRVEGNGMNESKSKIYTSILSKLYSELGDMSIAKTQVLKEMVTYGCFLSNLDPCSTEATLLNRCLESILLSGQINENTESWKKWCRQIGQSKGNEINMVVEISTTKVHLATLITTMIHENMGLSKLNNNRRMNELLQKMDQLLATNRSYEHSLHVWFLKQFYMCKGIHWIEMVFTHSAIRRHFPLLGKVNSKNVFRLLSARTLCNSDFNPFIGIYGNKNYRDLLHKNITQNFDLPVSCQMIAESLSLIRLSDHSYLEKQLHNLRTYIQTCNKELANQKIFWQIFTLLTSSPRDTQLFYWKHIKDSLDLIVIRLCFHFMAIIPFMKRNPFRFLFEPDSFLVNTDHNPSSDEHLKIRCLHNHSFVINTSLPKNMTCPWKGCGATIVNVSGNRLFSKLGNAINSKSIWFILKRYYTSPQKIEPCGLRPLISTLLRFLYHLLLLLRNEGAPQDGGKIQELMRQNDKNGISNLLLKKIKQDFKKLLSIALHLWIKDFFEKFETWYPQGLTRGDLAEIFEFERK
ncbi:hypothetical protein RFI_36805, partial [Reticulomyxa filosa]